MFSSSPLPSPPLIFDLGAHTLRAGVAGDALPRWIAPSVVGLPHAALSSSSFGLFSGSDETGCHASRNAGPRALLSLAPLNPLEKRDHVELSPVVFYQPSALRANAGSGNGGTSKEDKEEKAKKKRKNEDFKKEDRGAEGACSVLGAAGGWGNAPGVYSVDMPGFRRLLETACGPRGLDEGTLEGRSVLLTEPNVTNRSLRDSFAEMLFEDLKVSRAFLCKKAALACFGCARTSGIVADVGHSNTSVCAVQEGFVLQKAVQEFPFAASHCAAFSRGVLQHHGVAVTPGFAVVRTPLKAEKGTRKGEKEERERGRRKGATAPGERRRSAEHDAGLGRSGAKAEDDGRGAETKAGEDCALPGVSRVVDEKNNEVVHVAPCPHVTASYRDWGELHIVEVLGECRSRQDAAAMVTASLSSAASQASRGRPKAGLRRGKASASRGSSESGRETVSGGAEGEKKRDEREKRDEDEDRAQAFVLPDGTKLSGAVTDAIRAAVPETLFSAPMRLHYFSLFGPAGSGREESERVGKAVCDRELVEAVKACVLSAGSSRRDTTATVIPTGGGSLYPGFLDRFREEMQALQQDPSLAVLLAAHRQAALASLDADGASGLCTPLRVVASPVDAERHFASWIGGSILGCLGSFSQFCVTQAEYDEYGARVAIDRKCP
ncbi:putative actin-like protein 3b [Neospora caninum Liverpool]|uniref:Actin-like protein 3b, putative n=1 Tax=Neospora caninum (strain Liverpool) TaxID=572307 RepID=F0VQS9_NEOCL|nr:putative actin-like protein 3b [Neospora caninum Liverpool]CBZ56076.1 putative actin-like protein 3b [Neospora caninum Liverpool]CEL70825.1 TPA: actin-like protein 3b, putative [Neospora caninum Liverpool]|eukprot:XP_003886102.1 putative actin-like protein 3b [Neospora caninum Liverpool]